ncbi:Protein transport protein Sec24B [Galemys pyrenaicus]|uniref:Protein transport protein Sec24B n=1 Tax=Galemys pyrenaicus TaxID=202257 RepID=A0A8J6AE98_GALPY|nr:Protein transport protein Sec24B [Galemys pyrenaicus]
MSAPAGSPHPAASARIPPKLGGAAAPGAAPPAGPGPAPPQQNGYKNVPEPAQLGDPASVRRESRLAAEVVGFLQAGISVKSECPSKGPAQTQMQAPSGYGLYPQNYSTPSGHYTQGPGKMTALPLDGQCGNYYSGLYPVPTQNLVTPNTANQQPGAQQIYGRGPPAAHVVGSTPGSFQGAASSASHLHTSASQSYSSLANHYSSPTMYSASSSVASQGFPSTCGHYALSTVSNPSYPSVSYPSLPAGDPYGQHMFTSQNAVTGRLAREPLFPGQSAAATHPSLLPPPPAPSQQYQQQQSLSGYNTVSWSASGLPLTQDSLVRNHNGSLISANNNNPTNTGMQYGDYVNNQASSAPTPLSSTSDDEEEEEEDEEAGVDSSSTTSSASPVPNSYDALEGGNYPVSPEHHLFPLLDILSSSASSPAPDHTPEPDPVPAPAPTTSQPSKMVKPFGYGYPTLQPGYQNAAGPLTSGPQPSSSVYSGFQQYAQQYPGVNQLSSSLGGLSLQSSPQPESLRPVNLTQERNILPPTPVWAPVPNLNLDLKKLNCSPE